MKPIHPFLFAVILILFFPVFSAAQGPGSEEGIFLDTLKVGNMSMRLAVTISKNEEGVYKATLNSIDQGSGEIPIDEVTINGSHIFLKAKIGIQIEGDYDEPRNKITGEFRQGPGKFPLVFKRVDALQAINRPQEPKPPFPYTAEEVVYRNEKADVQLAGTLTIPEGEGPFPAVVMLTGSGPQNRDEQLLGHKPFLVIADFLTRNGIAVLRADDRGVGSSTGNFATATTGDFAEDGLAGIEFLKTRKEVNQQMLGCIGHSEGGIMAPVAASQSNDISFIILLAGPGSNLGDNVTFQRIRMAKQAGASEESLKVQEKCLQAANDIARKDISDEEARLQIRQLIADLPEPEKQLLNWSDERVGALASQLTEGWWRYSLKHDTENTIKSLKIPVLALLGEKDMQVPVALNLSHLERALENGHQKNRVVVMMGLNHLFQPCETGDGSEYVKIEETISPEVLHIMTDWIKKL
jgi:uncharacterized protein